MATAVNRIDSQAKAMTGMAAKGKGTAMRG